MMRHLSSIGLAFLCATSLAFSQELNVLVIGSTHSFSEGAESGVVHEKPFNPAGIATHLQGILAQDPAITDTVHVEFEDIYKTKFLTVNYSGSNVYDFTSRCYSLAQHFMWPDGKATRLSNLRGEGTYQWDYIVLCNDPYITANFPGMVAEGVKLIKAEVAKSAHPAQVVLFAQWPESSSSFTANQFNEIAFRVGNSAGLTVVPAGKAWDSYSSKDTSSDHPTPRGEYLAAASIYSKLFDRSAKTSAYDYPAVGDAIADHALSVVQANAGVAQYAGTYTSINPFQMKQVTKRLVSYRETGTSTEDRIAQALGRLDDVQRITFNTTGYAGTPGTRWDFNYGRGNDWWEPEKQYDVNSTIYDWVYGFPMHHYSTTSAPTTMPYGIDKHYYYATTYEDGTDLGIPYNMIRPGTREPDWPEAVRAVPIRLMWQKMCETSPGFNPLGDSTHMHPHLNDASAAFMYTLLSGRCPVVAEPSPSGSTAWMQWLGHKTGYETAWQMSHLTTRAPGFRVLPSATTATTVTPTTTETMTVQFAYPPQADVTVAVSSSSPTAAIVSPKTLIFTPSNYHTPQQLKVAGIPGAAASPAFNVNFSTSSSDEIYHGLSDSWAYTNTRSATSGLTQVDNGSSQILVEQYTTKVINLGVAAANAGNTVLAGPFHGSIIWQGNGVIVYTPVTGYTGTDQIVFAVTNGTTQTIGCVDISVEISDNDNTAPVVDAGQDQSVTLSGSAPWLPNSLSPQAWYDASDASTITSSGGFVSEWRDKTINNRDASQLTGASQPATGSTTMGDLNVITFNGSSQFFNVNLDYLAGATHSAFIVTRTTAYRNIYGAATGNSGANSLHVGFSSNTQYRMNYWGNDWNGTIGTAFSSAGGNVLNYIWTPGVSKQIFANGTSQGTSANAGVIGTMAGGGRIGNVVGQGLYGGDIAEMVFITGSVDAAARERMEGYLAHKWSLTGNLPLQHPFRIQPPGGAGITVNLDATVTDADGQIPTTIWIKVSGPGAVTFAAATAVDTTASFTQAGTYVLRLTANDGIDQAFDEITITVSEPQTFSSWIGGFTGLGGLTGFDDDADGDGIKNGVEAFFGTVPNAPSAGLSAVASSGNSLTITHPEADPPLTDMTGSYEWSLNLSAWHASGAAVGGTTVTIGAAQDSPQSGTTTVTANVNGTEPGKIFVRAVATRK